MGLGRRTNSYEPSMDPKVVSGEQYNEFAEVICLAMLYIK